MYHAYDEQLITSYFPGLHKDTLDKLLTLSELTNDDQVALRETFQPEQIVPNLDPYYLANAMCQPTLCERAMNHHLIGKNRSGVMINPWRTNNSIRGYGPEDRTLLEYNKETEETVITDYGKQIATQMQDIFISGSICTSPRCKSTALQHNTTKLHFGYSNEEDRKAPRTLYFVDCKTGACRDKLLRIVICRTVISYEEHLQRLEEVRCKERTEALAQLVARLPRNNPMHQLANLATPTTTNLQQQQAQQTHTEAAATLQQTQVVIQPTPLVNPMTSISLEHPVDGTKPVQQINRQQRKR
jgi:hypothetical protein